jgi:hypothetical protein
MIPSDDGDDGGRQRAEGHQRDRSLIGALPTRHDQGGEEERGDQQRADREENDAEVVERMRL